MIAFVVLIGLIQTKATSPLFGCVVMAQEEKADNAESNDAEVEGGLDVKETRAGYLVKVPLPIDHAGSEKVHDTLKLLAEKSKNVVRGNDAAVVVLEFETGVNKTGRGSEMGACMSLAQYLSDPELNRIQTVAYVPRPRMSPVQDPDVEQPPPQLNGHAVLVAIAANQLALESGTAIGAAGIDVDSWGDLEEKIYQSVAERRLRSLPVPVVMSMLNKDTKLWRVETVEKSVRYVNDEEQKRLELSGEADDSRSVSEAGEFTVLTAEQMTGFRLPVLVPKSRADLERMLNLSPNSLSGNPADSTEWNAVQIELPRLIDKRTVKWVIRSLNRATSKSNLVILKMDSSIGDVNACIELSQHLASYDPSKIRTMAFLKGDAKGPVGLIPLSCSHITMSKEARLGGKLNEEDLVFYGDLDKEEIEFFKPVVIALAESRQSDGWSMMMSMLDPVKYEVTRYIHKKDRHIRFFCNEELLALDNPNEWDSLGPIGGAEGINANQAFEYSFAQEIAEDMGQIQTSYGLDRSPRQLVPSATDRWVERLAKFLASPAIAPFLLFGAMFFFSTEMSAPGLGIPGFLATVCFGLFFWSQFLDGNADWLEIMLFVVGAVFVAMEVFVIPGFGIFGIGGLLMMIISLVLASQSFIIPRTTEELAQIPYSMTPVIGAAFGVIAGAFVLRKIIPHSPYLKHMLLEPRVRVETGLGGDPEAVVDWSYLMGQTGVTVTRLFPSGKARIGGDVYDVITKGQMLDKGERVVVIEAMANRVVVRAEGSSEEE
ncbi:MAG: NfeD family protein [Mariniblastus sp.]